jgi:hypothetical protein
MAPRKPASRPRWQRVLVLTAVLIPCLAGIGFAGYHYQEKVKAVFQPPQPEQVSRPPEVVGVESPGVVVVTSGTPLEKKLKVHAVESEELSVPALTVAGSVVARLGTDRKSVV